MVPVTFYHICHRLDVIGVGVELPVLIPDGDAEPVKDVEQNRIRWVMRHPPRVPAHTSELLRAEEVDAIWDRHTDPRERIVVAGGWVGMALSGVISAV